jgi:hypothetical protein
MILNRMFFLAGVFLLSLPLLHHAYFTWQFSQMISVVVHSAGSANFLELPTMLYAASLASGAALVITGIWLSRRPISVHDTRQENCEQRHTV